MPKAGTIDHAQSDGHRGLGESRLGIDDFASSLRLFGSTVADTGFGPGTPGRKWFRCDRSRRGTNTTAPQMAAKSSGMLEIAHEFLRRHNTSKRWNRNKNAAPSAPRINCCCRGLNSKHACYLCTLAVPVPCGAHNHHSWSMKLVLDLEDGDSRRPERSRATTGQDRAAQQMDIGPRS